MPNFNIMKVAIVLNTSWNIYNFRLGLIRKLIQKGITVYCVAPRDKFTTKLEQEGCIFKEVKMDRRGANPLKDLGLLIELYRIYREIDVDAILHYTIKPNIYGTLAAHLLNIPVINNVCGLGTVFMKKGFVAWLAKVMYKISFRYPRKIFFQNPQDRDLFIDQRLTQSELTDILPGSGINLAQFTPAEDVSSGTFTFLMISRLIYDKGVVEYVNAVKKLKDQGVNARFQLLGATDTAHKRGIDSTTIQQWIKDETIEYLGHVDDVSNYISNASCIVLPSYREGTPRTLLEGASMGKPLIATDVPGCTNVVQHEYNGYLCKQKDAEDLAEKMERMLLQDSEKLSEMGRNSRSMVEERFDESIVIKKYLEEIEQLKAS